MTGPAILFVLSLGGLLAAFVRPDLADAVLLVAGPASLASLFLLVRAGLARRRSNRASRNWVVIDGSNAMYWQDNTPRIGTVRAVVTELERLGYAPCVIFDANAGHLMLGRYLHDDALARHLGLPANRVMVVDRGTPADPRIIMAAQSLGAGVVTNDRYRDWEADHPEVRKPGFLIRGGYRGGRLWIDLDAADSSRGQGAARAMAGR